MLLLQAHRISQTHHPSKAVGMYINTEPTDRADRRMTPAGRDRVRGSGSDGQGPPPPPSSESVYSPGGKGRAHDDDAVVSG